MTLKSFIIDWLPLLISVITIYSVWQAGNKTKWTWALSGFNQVLWFTWIVTSKNWNFLFMNVALTVIYIRNHRKWNQSQEKPE